MVVDSLLINIWKSQAYECLCADESIPIKLDPCHKEVTQVVNDGPNHATKGDSQPGDSEDDDSSMSSAYLHDSSPNDESSSEGE